MRYVYNGYMKLIVQIQLLPDAESARKLQESMERFNEAANWAAGVAFERRISNKISLQQIVYRELRDRFGLSAQVACLCVHRVCEAYKRDKTVRPKFGRHSAVSHDIRTMSFKGIDRVSLLTLEGRVVVPFVMGAYQAERFPRRKGQCDLVLREDGKWFLLVTIDVPAGPEVPAIDFIGVDMGINKMAVDSDGNEHSGDDVDRVRRRHNTQRKRLQRKGTKGARKRAKRLSKKEARFRRHQNHCISKAIVESARRTSRGIAVEDLGGIRQRVTARGGDARNRLSGWSFHQLYGFLSYKAALAGIPIVSVDPRNTSRACSECGHCEKANRKSQAEFLCLHCGFSANADWNAALNIRAQAKCKLASGLAAVEAKTGNGTAAEASRKATAL
jgi:IS605 OrfB family transposase